MTTTNSFLRQVRDLLLKDARKALTGFLISAAPAVVALVQKDYGVAIGAGVASLLTGLGVYKVANQ